MSWISPEHNSDEPIIGWYSVISGQGIYDVRAYSQSDAGDRMTRHIKAINDNRLFRAEIRNLENPEDETVGLPLVTEYPLKDAFFKEIIWRRTGGDENNDNAFIPRMTSYHNADPYVVDINHTKEKAYDPNCLSLFATIGDVAMLTEVEAKAFISGLIMMSPLQKNARITSVPL